MKRGMGLVLAAAVIGASTTAAEAKVTLTWLQGNSTADVVRAVVVAFEKEHPNIKINPIVVPWDQVDNKFLAMTVGGVGIDIFSNSSAYGWARYRDKGLLLPLDPYITRDKAEVNLSDLSPKTLNAYKYKGKQISFPSSQCLACSVQYNAVMLAEAGLPIPTSNWDSSSWTWDDMMSYAKKLTKSVGGKVSQYGVDFWNADNLVTFAWANGGDYFDAESYKTGKANKIVINSPENVQAFSKVAELSALNLRGAALDGFRGGKLAMWLDAASVEDHTNKKLFKNDFKWGFAPFPMMQVGNREAFAWNEVLAVPASAKHRAEGWEFIKWYSKVAGTKGMGWPSNSARKSVWAKMLDWTPLDTCALDKAQMRQFVEGGLVNARQIPRDVVFGSQEIITAANVGITRVLEGKMSAVQGLAKAQADGEIAKKKIIRK